MISLERLRRQILLRLNEVSFLAEADAEAELARQLVSLYTRGGPRRRLVLRPAHAPERGPDCVVCTAQLTTAQALVACPSCLVVFHAGCWLSDTPCATVGCAADRQ